jgi:steroid delta-isomerase-like uncharacterized protein
MSVFMISEVPGADAGLVDGLRAAGIPAAMAAFPGFVSHVSGAAAGAYRVVEVWESREDHQAWYDQHIARNLPAGAEATTPEYVDVTLTVPEPTDHTATMRRTYELISAGEIERFGDLLAEDFVEHQEAPGLPPTKAGVLELFRVYRAAFPDLTMDAVDVLGSGDRTVARVRVSGTHTGDFMGMPATGRHAAIDLIDIMRFDDTGLVCEHWGLSDMLSLLQQLGVVPDAAAV